jgi:hydrogenase expression/formation protein HypC
VCLAIPGRLIDRTDGPSALPFGRVSFGSVVKEVCLAYTPEAQPGDYLVVHVGFAIQQLDEDAARRALALVDGEAGG